MTTIRSALVAAQAAAVAALEAELATLVAAGDEYHAAGVREDIVAASSLARLVHKDEGSLVFCDVCGCARTERQAASHGWGVLLGRPTCGLDCAEALYEPWFARSRFKPASADLPLRVAPWVRFLPEVA